MVGESQSELKQEYQGRELIEIVEVCWWLDFGFEVSVFPVVSLAIDVSKLEKVKESDFYALIKKNGVLKIMKTLMH